MKQVTPIFKREFVGYFRTPVAYVFLVPHFLLISVALAFSRFGGFFKAGVASLDSYFGFFPWLYLFIGSVGMRLWSEEKRSGTAELLFTLPVTTLEAVIGKFLAGWAFLALGVLLSFPMAVTIGYLGSPDWGVVCTSYLGARSASTRRRSRPRASCPRRSPRPRMRCGSTRARTRSPASRRSSRSPAITRARELYQRSLDRAGPTRRPLRRAALALLEWIEAMRCRARDRRAVSRGRRRCRGARARRVPVRRGHRRSGARGRDRDRARRARGRRVAPAPGVRRAGVARRARARAHALLRRRLPRRSGRATGRRADRAEHGGRRRRVRHAARFLRRVSRAVLLQLGDLRARRAARHARRSRGCRRGVAPDRDARAGSRVADRGAGAGRVIRAIRRDRRRAGSGSSGGPHARVASATSARVQRSKSRRISAQRSGVRPRGSGCVSASPKYDRLRTTWPISSTGYFR